MSKYKKITIYNYVMGNDIVGYDIDELEKDYEFMLEVLKLSNDKKMYSLCDDDIKHNYYFVRGVIEHFKNDKKFIIEVANEFLSSCDNEIEEIEINILIGNSSTNIYDEDLLPFRTITRAFYNYKRLQYETTIQTEEDIQWKNNWGMGFWITLNEYKNSDIIKTFIAEKMVQEIFQDDKDFTLERYLHQRFKDVESLLKMGIKEYIISYISGYDESLSGYITSHIEIIDDIVKRVNKVIKNWQLYERNKIDNILGEIHNFLSDHPESILLEEEVVAYLEKELKIKGLIEASQNYDEEYEEVVEQLNAIINNEMQFIDLNIENLNFRDYSLLIQLRKRVQELYKGNDIDDSYIETDKKRKAEIININFNEADVENKNEENAKTGKKN